MSILIQKIANTSFRRRKCSNHADDAFYLDRTLFVADGCLANAISILTSGAILSGYAYYLGASEEAISLIAMLPTLLNVVQIFSSVLLENKTRKKKILVICLFIHRSLLGGMFFLPLCPISSGMKVLLLALFYGISYFFGAFTGAACGDWILKLVPKQKVGSYLGLKDSLSLAALTITSLAAGKMLDHYKSIHAELAGFVLVGILLLLLAVWDFMCLVKIEEPLGEVKKRNYTIKETLLLPLRDKEFKKVMFFYGFWNVAINVANPLFSIYMVGYLHLDYFYIMLVSMLGSIARVGAAVLWGKMADRISWIWVCRSSIGLLSVTVLLWAVTGEWNYTWLLPVIQICSGIAWGGIAIATFNIQFAYAPADKKILYVSTNTALASVAGFAATMIGVALVAVIPDATFFGRTMSSMQTVFLLSAVMMMGCTRFMKKKF